ncbi:MAG: hypothetical protein KGI25_02780 [Thaumarchaeota archaeon]|nr:hypothetical protein [Nitrososphaerota archaeon]
MRQKVDLTKFLNFEWGIYDGEIYGGRCGYVKLPETKGKVTVFSSGKVISIGAKSTNDSFKQLNNAKFQLLQANLIFDVEIEPKIQNIVATLSLDHSLSINKMVRELRGAIYEPDQFPAVILKSVNKGSYLIFASGKIVISGCKSDDEIMQASFEIQQKIESIHNHP